MKPPEAETSTPKKMTGAIHQRWKAAGTDVARYEAGTWGPSEAEALLLRDGRSWRRP